MLGQFQNRILGGIAEVERPHVILLVHHADQALDEVVDVTKRARLRAIAIDGERLTLERLDDEVRNHPAVVGVHARAVGIEDAHDAHLHAILLVVVHAQRLGAALAFVVAGAGQPD